MFPFTLYHLYLIKKCEAEIMHLVYASSYKKESNFVILLLTQTANLT